MNTKYIVTTTNKVAIWSRYLGLEHSTVALDLVTDLTELSSAGFCYLEGNQIITYGKSISTGLGSRQEDAGILTQMLHGNELTTVFLERQLGYLITNDPSAFHHDEELPTTVGSITKYKIFQ